MLRFLLIASAFLTLPLGASASPTTETKENDFLDLVDGSGNVLVQGKGVGGVNAKARAEGLKFPALGYWSLKATASSHRPQEIATESSKNRIRASSTPHK